MKYSCPIQLETDTSAEHLIWSERDYGYTCEGCGDSLLLDKIFLEKMRQEKAIGMVEHIVKTQVVPWIQIHLDCGEVKVITE